VWPKQVKNVTLRRLNTVLTDIRTNTFDSTQLLGGKQLFIEKLKALKQALFLGTQNQKHLN
jgi:hypothetical protein